MTLEELVAAVRAQMGTPDTDPFYTDAILTSFINNAIQYISLLADWPWLLTKETITTSADDAEYNLPEEYLKTKSITRPGHRTLKWVHEEDALVKSSNGTPCEYFVGPTILLSPTPVDAGIEFTHSFYAAEPYLVSDDDEPILPAQYQFAIVHYAAKLAWDRGQRDTDAQREFAQFKTLIKEVLKKANPTSGPKSPKVV